MAESWTLTREAVDQRDEWTPEFLAVLGSIDEEIPRL
jgi:hypothetical protein